MASGQGQYKERTWNPHEGAVERTLWREGCWRPSGAHLPQRAGTELAAAGAGRVGSTSRTMHSRQDMDWAPRNSHFHKQREKASVSDRYAKGNSTGICRDIEGNNTQEDFRAQRNGGLRSWQQLGKVRALDKHGR